MTPEELTKKYQQYAQEGQPLFSKFTVLKVDYCNFKPHPYVIGVRHVVHASDHHSGMLGEETLRAIPCEYRSADGTGCHVPHDQHTHDTVLFLQLCRNLGNKEAADALFAIKDEMVADKIDGFAFVESDEKFRIAPPEEKQDAGPATKDTEVLPPEV